MTHFFCKQQVNITSGNPLVYVELYTESPINFVISCYWLPNCAFVPHWSMKADSYMPFVEVKTTHHGYTNSPILEINGFGLK